MLTNALICPDSEPIFLNFFDLRVAPPLLFYAYLPIVIISLFLGIFIFSKNKSLQGKLLLALSVVFSLWVIDLIIQWVSVYVSFDFFFWQTTPLLEVTIPLISIYFVYVFLNKKDLLFWQKILLAVPYIAMCILMPTKYNVTSFDLWNCEGIFGNFYDYVYAFEIAMAFLAGYLSVKKYKEKGLDITKKREALWLGVGSVIFLLIFAATNIYGEITRVYEINLLGPLGMAAFMALLSFLIVRYSSFNIRLIGAQVLVFVLVFLLFAMLFVRTVENVRYVIFATLIVIGAVGFALIRSVKREARQREEIAKLAVDLQIANDSQTELIRFVTHQVKGFFTKSRAIFAGLLEGDFGDMPETLRPPVEEGLRSDTKGVEAVQQILEAANIRKGTIAYDKKKFNFKSLVSEEFDKLEKSAEKKGLRFELETSEDEFQIVGDRSQLSHAIRNLIDNAIRYTPKGSVLVSLYKQGGIVILEIKDTGVGITEEDKKKLFTEGGRGKDSTKINVDSTGFGLYIVKNIVESHNGKVSVHSEGAGKGSTFTIELPH